MWYYMKNMKIAESSARINSFIMVYEKYYFSIYRKGFANFNN